MKRYLMVCLGNICRSPIAQGLLQHHISQQGKLGMVDSCGTGGWHAGESPDPRSQAVMSAFGLDISKQRARQFRQSDFDEFDEIFVMDSSNLKDLMAKTENPNHGSKISLILDETHPMARMAVPDPYYGGDDGFTNVYHMLDKACTKIASRL